MKKMQMAIQRFWADEEGVTAIEYGLLAALIAVVIIAGAATVGTNLNQLFKDIGGCLKDPSATCMPAAG